MNSIAQIQKHAEKIKSGDHDKCGPGHPIAMSNALQVNEGVSQGDVMFIVVDKIPEHYINVTDEEGACHLAVGDTIGASHHLDDNKGVTIWRDPNWNTESLDGPILVTEIEKHAKHYDGKTKHGTVIIPPNMMVGIFYDREFDMEIRKERRAAD